MGEKRNIQQIIELFATKFDVDLKQAKEFTIAFFELIVEALERDRYVKIKGLGVFKLVDVDSRESINVNTGERFEIQSYTKISFTPENSLKDRINKPFAHFETVILNEGVDFEKEKECKEEASIVEDKKPLTGVGGEENKAEEVGEEAVISEVLEEIQGQQEEEIKDFVVSEEVPLIVEECSKKNNDQGDIKNNLKGKERKRLVWIQHYSIIAILAVFVVLGFLFSYQELVSYFSPEQEESTAVELFTKEKELPDPVLVKVDTVQEDNLIIGTQEKVVSQVDLKSDVLAELPKINSQTPVQPDSINYNIIGTKAMYTLQEGETLIKVSVHFYGTKNLWPYLLMHNKDIIKNPDRVPHGITLKIPELQRKE